VSAFFSSVTAFLSFAIVIIAVLQWRVADNKLRLDLFDRRYKVYAATLKFVAASMRDSAAVDSHLNEFNIGTSDAEFLFDADVVNYLQQIRERAVMPRPLRVQCVARYKLTNRRPARRNLP
jgi:hypothetical protein